MDQILSGVDEQRDVVARLERVSKEVDESAAELAEGLTHFELDDEGQTPPSAGL